MRCQEVSRDYELIDPVSILFASLNLFYAARAQDLNGETAMSDQARRAVHWSFWVIAALTLIWNLLGVANFVIQLNPENVAAMPETHRAIVEGRPFYATFGFAAGVFGGAIGCIALLFRRKLATPLFIASFIGVLLTVVHSLSIADTAPFSLFETFMMIIMTIVIAAFLIWYARWASAKGWIA